MKQSMSGVPITMLAYDFSTEKHAGQMRKYTGRSYMTHVVYVSELLYRHKESSNIDLLGAICMLHDTLEDTDTTYKELCQVFGKIVADTVQELTNVREDRDKLFGGDKVAYINWKLDNFTSYALTVKTLDFLANIRDCPEREDLDNENLVEYREWKMRLVVRVREHWLHIMGSPDLRLKNSSMPLILAELDKTLLVREAEIAAW